MSKLKFLKPLTVMITGAFVGFYSVQFFVAQPSSQNRFLASATISKLGSEQFAKTIFDIKITNEEIAATSDEVSTVKVVIEALQKIPVGLTYSWHLPENATVVDGSTTGFVPELEENQSLTLEIKLKGYAHDIKNHVVFKVKGDIHQGLVDQNVIVSSRPEDSFEYVVQNYEKAQEKEAKVKNKMGKSATKPTIDPKNAVF